MRQARISRTPARAAPVATAPATPPGSEGSGYGVPLNSGYESVPPRPCNQVVTTDGVLPCHDDSGDDAPGAIIHIQQVTHSVTSFSPAARATVTGTARRYPAEAAAAAACPATAGLTAAGRRAAVTATVPSGGTRAGPPTSVRYSG
eukprot:338107-Hanusia_phi.AAC.1